MLYDIMLILDAFRLREESKGTVKQQLKSLNEGTLHLWEKAFLGAIRWITSLRLVKEVHGGPKPYEKKSFGTAVDCALELDCKFLLLKLQHVGVRYGKTKLEVSHKLLHLFTRQDWVG